jgi:hypothetical protein
MAFDFVWGVYAPSRMAASVRRRGPRGQGREKDATDSRQQDGGDRQVPVLQTGRRSEPWRPELAPGACCLLPVASWHATRTQQPSCLPDVEAGSSIFLKENSRSTQLEIDVSSQAIGYQPTAWLLVFHQPAQRGV